MDGWWRQLLFVQYTSKAYADTGWLMSIKRNGTQEMDGTHGSREEIGSAGSYYSG
jgi:hypothetical protein